VSVADKWLLRLLLIPKTLPHADKAIIPNTTNIESETVRFFRRFFPYVGRKVQENVRINTARIIRLAVVFDFIRRISEPYGCLKMRWICFLTGKF